MCSLFAIKMKHGEIMEDKETKKNKRQIYVWPENKDFYDGLVNKSRLVNLLIKKYRQENEE